MWWILYIAIGVFLLLRFSMKHGGGNDINRIQKCMAKDPVTGHLLILDEGWDEVAPHTPKSTHLLYYIGGHRCDTYILYRGHMDKLDALKKLADRMSLLIG